jgi:hypothetical protein
VRPLELVLAALAALPCATQDAAQPQLIEPPARAAVAGLAGLAVTSELSGEDVEGRATESELSVWYVFPERARWQRNPRPARPGARELAFRYGPQTWRVEPLQSVSRRLAGEEARATELEFELRRALWMWPDGFAWSGEGGFRSAPVRTPAVDEGPPCFLVARLGEGGRPSEMGVAVGAAEGDARALLHVRNVTWRAAEERSFPADFDLYRGSVHAWHERVSATYLAPQALDHFFLPPDLKRGDLPVSDAPPREVRIPERAERRVELHAGEDWDAALQAAQRLAGEERDRLAPQGLALAPGVLIELDREGRPRAVRVELASLPGELPADWVRAPEQPAWDQRMARPGAVSAQQLARLRSFLGPSERPDWAFVRLAPDDRGVLRATVVQPFEPEVH